MLMRIWRVSVVFLLPLQPLSSLEAGYTSVGERISGTGASVCSSRPPIPLWLATTHLFIVLGAILLSMLCVMQ